jgi:parallel beta-helix repeat protein
LPEESSLVWNQEIAEEPQRDREAFSVLVLSTFQEFSITLSRILSRSLQCWQSVWGGKVQPDGKRTGSPQRFSRPTLEALEDRLAPAVFTVNTTLDNNTAGSLRWAITQANANPGSMINVSIGPFGSKQSIGLNPALGALPAITAATIIDATTQGGGGAPLVEINGNGITGVGLQVNSGGVEIKGLAIGDFAGDGVQLNNPLASPGDQVVDCYIGTGIGIAPVMSNSGNSVTITGANDTIGDPTGALLTVISGNGQAGVNMTGAGATNDSVYLTSITGNSLWGVTLQGGPTQDTIGGIGNLRNLISGNGLSGVYLNQASGNLVLNNYIGVDATGTIAQANGGDGVRLFSGSSNNMISKNIISGNTGNGVYLSGPDVTGNKLLANFIGTNAQGNAAVANGQNGVSISEACNNFIGDGNAGDSNVISGNTSNGVSITGTHNGSTNTGSSNTIAGDYIGLDVTGTQAIGNGSDGVYITSWNNFVGLAAPNGRNVISGNNSWGVDLYGAGLTTVVNNYVGTDKTGMNNGNKGVLANGSGGVKLWNAATQNTIGGTQPTMRNVISGNFGIGVYLTGAGVTGNFIQGDYIGVAMDGKTALGNTADGVDIERCANNTVGGAAAGAGNVISANGYGQNGGYGVELGVGSTGILVQNNFIGLDFQGNPGQGANILVNKSGWQNDLGNNNQWVNNTHN